ncbi:hypothetical protein JIN85_20025 [Luteolibacter pohnpeiensis]|uniref:Uncharacterized protein n=1 Tax=Luteolibacter pohnpeiensis TaxID=454153 RepID=A0A934S7V9_9BACT|nr:hypothetical protein [Luteolibacter pohnpeiensis]MBK1884710.1 hypothetical protein [Luteolibacter pohnpeiensis]
MSMVLSCMASAEPKLFVDNAYFINGAAWLRLVDGRDILKYDYDIVIKYQNRYLLPMKYDQFDASDIKSGRVLWVSLDRMEEYDNEGNVIKDGVTIDFEKNSVKSLNLAIIESGGPSFRKLIAESKGMFEMKDLIYIPDALCKGKADGGQK